MNNQDLEQKKFKFQNDKLTINDWSEGESPGLNDSPTPENEQKYVQIKKIELNIGVIKKEVLKIIDISKSVLYEQAVGEKQILTLINATVSHEMRNPCNSIEGQNIRLG